MAQTTNEAGLKLIKSFEGCHLKAYKLAGESYYTIGYGHSFDNAINANTVWTQEQADAQLCKDLKKYEQYVINGAKQHGFTFNDNQFSALVSYCYNRGAGGLKQLLTNSKNIAHVGVNIPIYWGSAVLYKNGLVRRRVAEQALFNTPVKSQVTQVSKPVASVKDEYYTTNPGKVKLLKNCGLYRSTAFTAKTKDNEYAAGTVFTITAIKKSANGTPRLLTKSGFYLTANKKYVKKV